MQELREAETPLVNQIFVYRMYCYIGSSSVKIQILISLEIGKGNAELDFRR